MSPRIYLLTYLLVCFIFLMIINMRTLCPGSLEAGIITAWDLSQSAARDHSLSQSEAGIITVWGGVAGWESISAST